MFNFSEDSAPEIFTCKKYALYEYPMWWWNSLLQFHSPQEDAGEDMDPTNISSSNNTRSHCMIRAYYVKNVSYNSSHVNSPLNNTLIPA